MFLSILYLFINFYTLGLVRTLSKSSPGRCIKKGDSLVYEL